MPQRIYINKSVTTGGDYQRLDAYCKSTSGLFTHHCSWATQAEAQHIAQVQSVPNHTAEIQTLCGQNQRNLTAWTSCQSTTELLLHLYVVVVVFTGFIFRVFPPAEEISTQLELLTHVRSSSNTENHVPYSPLHMRRGRWSPELLGTEWPAFHLQTDDCPPMSGTDRSKTIYYMPSNLWKGFKCQNIFPGTIYMKSFVVVHFTLNCTVYYNYLQFIVLLQDYCKPEAIYTLCEEVSC